MRPWSLFRFPVSIHDDGVTEPATIAETHVSWVIQVGDRAYKLKKPVVTGFLDFSTPEARRRACVEEVRVNSRLAPDVYLGVDNVRGANGEDLDYLVVMRRMPAERRLSTLVTEGADVTDALRDVAHRLASLHLSSRRSAATDRAALPAATLARWQANSAELVPLAHLLDDPTAPTRVLDLAEAYLNGRGRLLADRVGSGRAVDGHGDLLAEDIFVMDDGPRILDALEFDEALRLGDGLADAAFLAMDLEHLGAPDLATRFLGWYAEFAADHWPASLADHYIAYRAQVRAKVSCLRAVQEGAARSPEADRYLDLALRHLQAGQVRLVLIGGAPGTGKTTLARTVADANGWVVLRSDEIRKEVAGLAASASAVRPRNAGIYGPTMTALTYGEMLHRAEQLLELGETVVLDATWSDAAWREEARRTAEKTHAHLAAIRCVAPDAVAEQRVATRLATGADASDATPAVARAVAERFAPWPEAAQVDTSVPPGAATEAAVRHFTRAG